MKTHFEIPINYNGKTLAIKVQCLSKELPKITYAVWLKDKELEKYFENSNLYFIIETKDDKDGHCTIWHSVKYDYKSNNFKSQNLQFEFAVWEALSILNN